MDDVRRREILQHVRRTGDFPALGDPELLPEGEDVCPTVRLALARARFQQGLLRDSHGLLLRAAACAAPATDPPQGIATGWQVVGLFIQLELAHVRMRTELAITASLTAAAEARAALVGPLTQIEELEASRLQTRLLQIAGLHFEAPRDRVESAEAALPAVADALAEAGWQDEAWGARLSFAATLKPPAARLRFLGDLVRAAAAAHRPDIAAEGCLDRAKLMQQTGADNDTVQRELQQALAHFRDAGHCTGPVTVAAQQALLRIRRERADLDLLEPYLEAYTSLQDYTRPLLLLLDLGGEALQRGQLEATRAYRARALTLATQTGEMMALDTLRMAVVDDLIRRADFGQAIQLCEGALAEPLPRFKHASYQQLLGVAYAGIRDGRAISCFERAIAGFTALQAWEFVSDATAQMLNRGGPLSPEEFQSGRALLETWLQRDLVDGRHLDALKKSLQTAQRELDQIPAAPTRAQEHVDAAQAAINRAQELLPRIVFEERPMREAQIATLAGHLALQQGREDEFESHFKMAADRYGAARHDFEAASTRYLLGCYALNRANQGALQPYYPLAETRLQQALGYFVEVGMREWAANTRLMLARLLTNSATAVAPENHAAMLDAAIDALSDAEADWSAVRSDFAAGPKLGVQTVRQGFAERSLDVYELALRVLAYRQQLDRLWGWVQRAKARGLADTIGLSAKPPAALLARLASVPEAHGRVMEEFSLSERVRSANATDKLPLTHQLNRLRQTMAADARLSEYMALRGAAPTTTQDLAALAPQGAVFIDWITIANRLSLVAFQPGRTPQLWQLDSSANDLLQFVTAHLGPRGFRHTLRDAPDMLREIDHLIAPLSECSQPGDLLLLSPTGPLYAVPLHALHLDGRPLLHRNPVSYAPSLTILSHCAQRRPPTSQPAEFAFVGDPLGDRPEATTVERALAQSFATTSLAGADVTVESFSRILQQHPYLHYQGHARYDSMDPLNSYLPLGDGARYTARQLYELQHVPTELVTLAACETAASAVGAGDEPLGFVSALLVAGARSVVASLWPSQSQATAEIMTRFYLGFRSGLDKAHSLRNAMLEVAALPQYAAPYYWAPFSLYGDWK